MAIDARSLRYRCSLCELRGSGSIAVSVSACGIGGGVWNVVLCGSVYGVGVWWSVVVVVVVVAAGVVVFGVSRLCPIHIGSNPG